MTYIITKNNETDKNTAWINKIKRHELTTCVFAANCITQPMITLKNWNPFACNKSQCPFLSVDQSIAKNQFIKI